MRGCPGKTYVKESVMNPMKIKGPITLLLFRGTEFWDILKPSFKLKDVVVSCTSYFLSLRKRFHISMLCRPFEFSDSLYALGNIALTR